MTRIGKFARRNLHWLIVIGVSLLCAIFIIFGHSSEDGKYRTLDGNDAQIPEATKKFIEDAEAAMYRIMNEDAPTDEATIEEFEDVEGLGAATSLQTVLSRRLPDGNNDNGRGWQCSKYTAYLATGRKDYSSAHPDYGPVNGKDVAAYLVKNFGWKYTDKPMEGAIGSGGFNTKYGHTAMYLYSTGANTAMVNDANYVPLTVSTHNMNIAGWVWVVPGDYEPTPQPTPQTQPEGHVEAPTSRSDVQNGNLYVVKRGDTLSAIMLRREGYVDWKYMNDYAKRWVSTRTGNSVYYGWTHGTGYGLIAGDTIEFK